MTKLLCDNCGAECAKLEQPQMVREPRIRFPAFDTMAKFRVAVVFTLVEHSTGFGGPPDLCKTCQHDLIDALNRRINRFSRRHSS